MFRSDERGIAIVMAMFMTLIVSALAASMAYMARTETVSSQSYTTMVQARYAAESGLAAAANYLLSGEYAAVAPGTAGDALSNYTIAVSPVLRSATPVLLSTDASASNYPVSGVIQAFAQAASGTLTVSNGTVTYGAEARLLTMRQLFDTSGARTLQTWEITGTGRRGGSGSAEVRVSAIVERQAVPLFRYAAFATHNGCNALSFSGGATTRSYDSKNLVGGNPVPSNSDGHVGTNGGLDANGGTTVIHGALSTPREGVGACTASNVTAATIAGFGAVQNLITLPQAVEYPTPAEITPLPPLTSTTFNNAGCPSSNPPTHCTGTADGARITPPTPSTVISMGNVSVQGSRELRLNAGIYEINSLSLSGNGTIVVESGPVIFKIAGRDETMPLDLSGGGVSNPTFNPANLQFFYGGTGTIKVTGGADTAALVYAPNASASLHGSVTDFYGSIITKLVTATGGFNLYYDRSLQNSMMTAGNPVMSSFTWQTF
ncbi:hypothetical protein BH24ACI4_BH24ACI4_30680 [soil metagenome]